MPAGIADGKGSMCSWGPPTAPWKVKVQSVVLTKTLVEQGIWEGQKLCLTDVTAELGLQVELFSSSSATYFVQ